MERASTGWRPGHGRGGMRSSTTDMRYSTKPGAWFRGSRVDMSSFGARESQLRHSYVDATPHMEGRPAWVHAGSGRWSRRDLVDARTRRSRRRGTTRTREPWWCMVLLCRGARCRRGAEPRPIPRWRSRCARVPFSRTPPAANQTGGEPQPRLDPLGAASGLAQLADLASRLDESSPRRGAFPASTLARPQRARLPSAPGSTGAPLLSPGSFARS